MRDLRPVFPENHFSHEQPQMPAWCDRLADILRQSPNQLFRREQLPRRDEFIIARRQQENWNPHLGEINRLSQGNELACR